MFELADGGTILLDEIGDMELKLQAKLLQVLQDQEFQRLGGRDTVKVDVRVIAATHQDLEQAITEHLFREDLYYRLNVIALSVPPLRERKEDILALADFFVRKHTPSGTAAVRIPASLQEIFLDYHWPGNVRELENMVRRFLVFQDAGMVGQDLCGKLAPRTSYASVPIETAPAEIPPPIEAPAIHAHEGNGANGTNGHSNDSSETITPVLMQVANAKREAERSAILDALNHTDWNRRQAAVLLQVDYKALLYKMKVLSITKEGVLTAAI
jgi:two-component system response regulator AtoC